MDYGLLFREPWFDEDGQTYWPTCGVGPMEGWTTLGSSLITRWNLVRGDSPKEAAEACPHKLNFAEMQMLSGEEWEARGFRTKEGWKKYRKAQSKKAEAEAAVYKAALADLTALVDTLRAELQAVHADVKVLRRQYGK